MRRFRTWRRARQVSAVFIVSAGVAACLASCQAGPGEPGPGDPAVVRVAGPNRNADCNGIAGPDPFCLVT